MDELGNALKVFHLFFHFSFDFFVGWKNRNISVAAVILELLLLWTETKICWICLLRLTHEMLLLFIILI